MKRVLNWLKIILLLMIAGFVGALVYAFATFLLPPLVIGLLVIGLVLVLCGGD